GRFPPPRRGGPSLGPRRSFLVICAVAQRREGPISSATTSTFERLSPSWVSQLRCSSRPATMTRAPRVRVSLTFSAISLQHTTSKKDVASSHSWVWRFCQRRLTASPKEAVGCPVLVNRSSGSRVMLPTRITLLSVGIVYSSRRGSRTQDQLAADWAAALRPR